MFCGTWNVRTLYKPGAALDLVRELEKYKMKCVTLQEVRWEDVGTTKISQTTIFNGKCQDGHSLEMGFAVHESIILVVKDFNDINPRLSTLTLKIENVNTVLINVHGPTEEKDEEEKEYFYASLANVFD